MLVYIKAGFDVIISSHLRLLDSRLLSLLLQAYTQPKISMMMMINFNEHKTPLGTRRFPPVYTMDILFIWIFIYRLFATVNIFVDHTS